MRSAEILIARTSDIFRIGALVSAPVVVALLLTQFVMALISKAVPTVNVFIISFPITVGVGLVLTIGLLPELARFMYPDITALENIFSQMIASGSR
jgi:flagellar biosynthetic protein FliR